MSLETALYVADLVPANPPGNDPKAQGDDHLRLLKTVLKNCLFGFTGLIFGTGTDGGLVNAYTLTPATPALAYSPRMMILFSPIATNTGAVTINISSLGPKDLRSVSGAPLAAGDLAVGQLYLAVYNGTEFRLTAMTQQQIQALAFNAALPAQPGGAITQFLQTLNGVASWGGNPTPDFLLMNQGVI
jgi:hypothetical protein